MSFCKMCGAVNDDNAKFCVSCGAPISPTAANQNASQTVFDKFNNAEDTTNEYSPADIETNKGMAILSYLSILVLVPILAAKESPFARFHANQGLVLLLAEFAYGVISGIINGIFGLFLIKVILSIGNLLFVFFVIFGIVNAVNGKAKKLPLIGDISLIK